MAGGARKTRTPPRSKRRRAPHAPVQEQIADSILETIGNTPLVRLHRVTRGVRGDVLAKLEFLNPGGSVKDRIGPRMIRSAEQARRLRPGGTIVEA
ncbi:MAG: pyridoxal-phosphate dependent enzyme, partial [Armatimonadetes bacterium]|nr:pyridoxal-phosphate dependent enzyme [Armatimonadota bacterium]